MPQSETVPGSGGEERQLALPLDPTVETPALREQTPWERMLADYRLTSLSVGVHPLELLRPHLPDGVLSSARARAVPQRPPRARRGDGGRASAPVDGEGRRLHAARGRARPDEPDRPAAGVRALPRARARRAAAARARPLRAARPEHERARRQARVARPARARRSRSSTSASRSRAHTTSATGDLRHVRVHTSGTVAATKRVPFRQW